MAENLFDIRKNDRRKKIIDENLDVANQIFATNPLFKNEEAIENEPEETPEEEIIEDVAEETDKEEIDKLAPISLSDFKQKENDKDRYTYYLDSEIDKLLIIVYKKFEIKSKSVLANLLLGNAILTNEDITALSETDKDVKKYYSKLFEKFKES